MFFSSLQAGQIQRDVATIVAELSAVKNDIMVKEVCGLEHYSTFFSLYFFLSQFTIFTYFRHFLEALTLQHFQTTEGTSS